MKQILLLGDPVAHSKSPSFQNAGIRECGLDASYACKHVIEFAELSQAAEECRRGAILGANITLPHKSSARSLADKVTAEVEVAGVANTWWNVSGELHADNTDIYGIQASIAAMGISSLDSVVVLGAGGAAVGAIFALRNVARNVSLVNRTLATAATLSEKANGFMTGNVSPFAWPTRSCAGDSMLADRFRHADLIIQATSLPVHRPGDEAPFSVFPWDAVRKSAGLLELCYASEATVAIQLAKAQQLRTLDGATMLLHQGLKSFERWFDVEAPAVVMRNALAAELGRARNEIPATPDRSLLDELVGEP